MSSNIDKQTKKSKKNQLKDDDEVPSLTKEETSIAKFLRLKCPNRQGNLVGMKVSFFVGNKLVDCLMESQWGPGKDATSTKNAKDSKQPLLASRQACVNFMQRLMNKQLFYRAVKIYKEPAETKDKESNEKSTPDVRKRNKEVKEIKNAEAAPASSVSATPGANQKEAKKKFKLEMHEEQKFFDTNEPYVWIYDPTSTTTYIIGLLLILGSIGICLFPLWPSQVREGVYYLSLTGATFLGAILSVALFKYILFGLIWACTFGKVSFWLFPNLTEDVGFFESFVPVYTCNGCSSSTNTTSKPIDNKASVPKEEAEEVMTESTINLNTVSSTPLVSKKTPTTKAISNELSKSTLMINSLASDSPLLKSKTNSKDVDEEFELVDNDELNKLKDSNEEEEESDE